MRDRHLSGQKWGASRTVTLLAVIAAVAGCVTTTPVTTAPTNTFALPTFASGSHRPIGPDDDVRIVDGYVTDTDGVGIPGARVTVNLDGTLLDEIETGNDGAFQIVGLYPPQFKVTVTADDYAPLDRSVIVDEDQVQTFLPDIAMAKRPTPVSVGAAGAVIQTPSGAAVAFQKDALPVATNVSIYDAMSAPPTDQLPTWDDGLLRTPLGWVEVSIEGQQPSKPTVITLPLSEQYEPGSVLEVRSIDSAREWSDEVQYAVVGESGRSAIAVVDHFSGWVVFTKRSQKVGQPTRLDRQELVADTTIGEGTENCQLTEPISLDLQTPPATFNHPVGIFYYFGWESGGWIDPAEQTVPSHRLAAQVQGVQTWRAHGPLVINGFSQQMRTEIKATWADNVERTRNDKIEWPDGYGTFVQEILSEYGVTAAPDELELPVTVERKTWNTETRVVEYSVVYPTGSPYWDLHVDTTPCPGQSPSATVLPTPTGATETPPPSATAPPVGGENTFSVSTSGLVATSISRTGPEDFCHVSILGGNYLAVVGSGVGSDGATYEWDAIVKVYAGPGTYTSDVNGHFEPALGDPRGYGWGAALPGAANTVTIGDDQRSGSFDLTLQPIVNSQTPGDANLQVTGTFSCALREG
jgi:hypothetical protein